jgi:tryptophanyl-tRNA synthetase
VSIECITSTPTMLRQAGIATKSLASHGNKGLSKVIFSGIQPTGVPHLGNFAGALRQWIQLQDNEPASTQLIFSVVDLHAITMPQPPERLREWRRQAFASLLAIGIDPDRATLFFQSGCPAHSELMWILSCTSSVGYLSRMTQWKVRLSKHVPAGTYLTGTKVV